MLEWGEWVEKEAEGVFKGDTECVRFPCSVPRKPVW